VDAFRASVDVHAATAARIFGVSVSDVTREQRARAKTVNFGVLYGQGPQRLSQELQISMGEAKAFIAEYFRGMPSVRAYMDGVVDRAREQGYVETVLGRRRRIAGLRETKAAWQQQAGARVAVNTVIQGSAADVLKVAMVAVHRAITAAGLSARLLLTVHDELVLECPESEQEALLSLVRKEMEGVLPLAVPLAVDMGTGPTWADAH